MPEEGGEGYNWQQLQSQEWGVTESLESFSSKYSRELFI